MKEKKDILIISQYFYPEYVTAAGLAFDTAKALAKAGFSVDVYCGYPKEYRDSSEKKYLTREVVEGVHIRRIHYFAAKRIKALGRLLNNFSFCWELLLRLPQMKKYRLIISYSSPPMVTFAATAAGVLFKNKIAFVAHDVYPEIAIRMGYCSENGLMAKMMRSINNHMQNHLSLLFCISSEMREFFIRERKVNSEIINMIPNWHEDLFTEESSFDKDSFTIGYLGNMGICQDMDTVLDGIDKLKKVKEGENIHFIFAGHGTKKEIIEKRTQNNPNVETYGFLQGDDYASVMKKCDCFIVSLEKGIDGLCAPSKTYSYLMMGKPLIAVLDEKDIIRDIEKYEMGAVIDNGDADSFANVVIELSENREKCKRFGDNARQCFLENYTREKCTAEYVNAVKKILP